VAGAWSAVAERTWLESLSEEDVDCAMVFSLLGY
jgi:hypothetical protein